MTYSNQDSLTCSKCGKNNDVGSLFCSSCGNSLKIVELEKEEFSTNKDYTNENNFKKQSTYDEYNNFSSKDYTDSELNLFLEKNQPYYIEKFKVIENTGNKKSWNWCAFLISGYWMLYRKMYIQAIIYILVCFLLSFIPFIGWILTIGLWVCAGIFGNSLYLDHIKKKFSEIACANNNMRELLISKKGGTNLVIPIILLIVPIIVGLIISTFVLTIGSMLYYY